MELATFMEDDFHSNHPGFAPPLVLIISTSVLIGTCGNSLLLVSILSTKELRVPGNYFIVSLAIADLIISGMVGPMHLIGIFAGESFFSNRPGLCSTVACICLIVCFSSVLSIAFIACNRYICVVHNCFYARIYTVKRTILYCICAWFMGFVFELPHLLGWGGHTFEKKTQSCLWDRQASLSYTIFFSSVPIGLPLLITFSFYVGIIHHVRHASLRLVSSCNSFKSSEGTITARETEKTIRLAKTTSIIFLAFLICWAPYAIIVVADVEDTFSPYIHGFSIVFAHLNSSINFFIYGLFNTSFRRAYYSILSCGTLRCSAQDCFSVSSHGSFTLQNRNFISVRTHQDREICQ